jgi:RNA polymerase sigma-70 factor (ECF subfamily)
VDDGQDEERVVRAWQAHRPYLVDLAFRMLGDIGAAEDAVQDAFSRLVKAMPGDIDDERGWLIVVTSRLCLDQIRSARSRRERPHDATEIEFVPPHTGPVAAGSAVADPADRVTLDESVRLALLVVLQRLTAAERVAFVLHDIFGVPFDTVATTVGRPAATCRQLARRARQKIGEGQGGARFDVGAAEHRLVTEKFIAACATGDLDGLLTVLAPDAWGDVDLGPGDPRGRGVVHGAQRVARNLLHYWGPHATLVSHPVDGDPALLGFIDRRLAGVLVFGMRGEKIQSVHVIGDPGQLSFLSSQLSQEGTT